MEQPFKTILVKGKTYAIDIQRRIIFNVDNPKDKRAMSDDDFEYFRELVKVYKQA